MKFIEFLNESRPQPAYRQFIDEETAKKLVLENCSASFKSNFLIYRGLPSYRNETGYILIDTTKTYRKSANTSNQYNVMLNYYLNTNNLPSRDKSMICSTDEERADNFGDVHVIIPFGDPLICSTGKEDLWDITFKGNDGNLYDYPHVNELLNDAEIYGDKTFFDIRKQIKLAINDGNEDLKNVFGSVEEVDSEIERIYNVDFYNDLYSKFKAKSKNEEIWFTGKAIAVNLEKYKAFINEVKK